MYKDGWVDGFISENPHVQIENRSIGGSPGIQFLRYARLDFSQYSAVIFDSAVNDENHLPYLGNIDIYRDLMWKLFDIIASQTRLVAIGFRNRQNIDKESEVFKVYRECCEERGGLFICVNSWVAANFTLGDDIYDDMAHIKRHVAYAFGRNLTLPVGALAPNRAKSEVSNLFEVIDGKEFSTYTQLLKSSSMMSAELALMPEGSSISFSSPLRVLGIFFDYRATHGAIKFHNSKTLAGQNLQYPLEDRLILKFVPFWGGVECEGLSVVQPHPDYAFSPEETADSSLPTQVAAISFLAMRI